MSPKTLGSKSQSAIVHLEYDVKNVPPKLEGNWTRFVCISDTHAQTFPVPDGDVLLHSGDLTENGTPKEFKTTMDWLEKLRHPVKIIIAGNHDLLLDEDWYDKKQGLRIKTTWIEHLQEIKSVMKNAGVVYLQDNGHRFKSTMSEKMWTVFGSPWTPQFGIWAFNYRPSHAKEIISGFENTDILLTHGPPNGCLDVTMTNVSAGCKTLAQKLPELKPRLHVFGHIHEAHGAQIMEWTTQKSQSNRTVFVNAANSPYPKGGIFGGPGLRPVVVDLLD